MASVTSASQCPRCNAPLAFDPTTGNLVCEYCDSVFTPDEIAAANAAKEQKASDAFEKEEARKAKEQPVAAPDADDRVDIPAPEHEEPAKKDDDAKEGDEAKEDEEDAPEVIPAAKKAQYNKTKWDESTISPDWGEDSENMVTYTCSTCGGEIMCDQSTGATHCPFCGNPTIVPGQFSVGVKPNYVIPFKLTKEQAMDALKKHYRKKPFLPKEFTNSNQIKKLQGTYVPFWLFNGSCAAELEFEATNSTSHREGDYIVTNTKHYRARRNGTTKFEKVPTDASKMMPDSLMDSIEPFDYSELVPFSTAYLSGFVANKYDTSIAECSPRADRRCQNTTIENLKNDVRGYESVNLVSRHTYINRKNVEYALLPVYTMLTEFDGKTYLFAMNGQTGKLVGDLPMSKSRYRKFTIVGTVIAAAALFALGFGGCVADGIWNFLFY